MLQSHRCASLSSFDIQHKTPTIKRVMPIPKAHYGGRHTVTMLPGAGIGPELMSYVKEVCIDMCCWINMIVDVGPELSFVKEIYIDDRCCCVNVIVCFTSVIKCDNMQITTTVTLVIFIETIWETK